MPSRIYGNMSARVSDMAGYAYNVVSVPRIILLHNIIECSLQLSKYG